jgi:hypothetical protein
MKFKMFSPFLNKPKIYNQKLQHYIGETHKQYLIKLNESCENNKKNMVLNSAIINFHNLDNITNNNKLKNNQIITSITCIFLASTVMIYLYNLRK